jgi:hypothetical protein
MAYQDIAHAVADLHFSASYPRVAVVRQHFDAPVLENVEASVSQEMKKLGMHLRIKPGMRVALTAGSRGINQIPRILKAVADEVRRMGGEPFIVPAMGSHGRATAEGQIEMLESLGITEQSVGVPIKSSMATVALGTLPNGLDVHMDKNAFEADAVIPINRVKPHTDFKGEIESGLSKMLAIGLGKYQGATSIHTLGSDAGLRTSLAPAARMMIEQTGDKFLGGIAIIENAYDQTAYIIGLPASEIGGEGEKALQRTSKELMPSLPFDQMDVVVVDECGKNISGAGMDPNVTGRMYVQGEPEFERPKISSLVLLDITEASHGNGSGVGFADVTTLRMLDKLDFKATYINGITAGQSGVQRIKLPAVVPTDADAIAVGLRACAVLDTAQARLVRIKNTLDIRDIMISESLLPEAKANPRLEVRGLLQPMTFDSEGTISPFPR